MKITVLQPLYFAGETPDVYIADFLLEEAAKVKEGLVVLPEYSNAGGLSDPDAERAALPRAEKCAAAERRSQGKMAFMLPSMCWKSGTESLETAPISTTKREIPLSSTIRSICHPLRWHSV